MSWSEPFYKDAIRRRDLRFAAACVKGLGRYSFASARRKAGVHRAALRPYQDW